MSEKKRPTAVKMLVLIVVIGSIIPVMAGVMMLMTGAEFESYFMQEWPRKGYPTYSILIGLIGLALAWGLWVGKGWAWTLTLIVSIIGIIMSLVALPTGIIGVIIDGTIVYLLMRSRTRKFYAS